MDISNYLSKMSKLVENKLNELVPEKNVAHQELYKAARYSLLAGGKRLRPILALATTEILQGTLQMALTPCCALEMIHTYSMIHDDLPCMDNDDFRRGKPSLHKAFAEGHAMLAGDFLLTYAFEILAHDPNLSPDQKIELIEILARHSGGEGMIAGQIMDLESEGKSIDLETLLQIHQNKTGALITASVEFGAVIVRAQQSYRIILREFSQLIGLAFQIVDDILDFTASKQKHGQLIASDLKNNKCTFVTLLGLEASKKYTDTLLSKAIQKLSELPYDISLLASLAEFIVKREI